MAAELVIGAFLSASFDLLLEKIASPCVEELIFLTGNNKSSVSERLFELKSTFNCLAAVRFEVENKRIKNPAVEKWLDDLLDAVDEAEDFFGDIEYDALKPKKARRIASKLLFCFSKPSNSTIDHVRNTNMEAILRRLEYLANQIGNLNLDKNVAEVKPSETLLVKTSLVDEDEVYGRESDKDALMKLLMTDDVGSQRICVIPILGMGGVGKTTLAQALFNDERVKNMFNKHKAWVYVSDKFDAKAVTKTILQKVAPDDARDDMDLDSLQVNLAKKLMGKKFLIVLDDAWEDDYVQWEEVMKPFIDGAKGSKIIVTTRNKSVADSIGTVDPHYLKELSKDECWELFAKHASRGNLDMFIENPRLESIGREVAKKCNGLPLAAKVLGGLLRSTLDAEKWEQIANSNIWELTDKSSRTLPAALEVSYSCLPPHLKRCFAYCSVFPKGYEFEREEMVLIWMAENLVKHSGGSRSRGMEELGNEYFDDLVSFSFFQPKTTHWNSSYFIMHDLFIDLARAVSGKYSCLVEHNEDIDKFEKKTRHLGCVMELLYHNDEKSSFNFEATHLRTFLSLGEVDQRVPIPLEVLHNLLLKLKGLRVLSFRYSHMLELPDSIGELKYLHYLDLSYTNIVKLPESITVLYNLQTLKLERCLKLQTLPEGLHHLISLRHLIIRGAGLVEMPSQMSKLTKLQILTTFVVGKESGAKIEELAELADLRGELSIEKLENVVNITRASNQASVLYKKQLEKLSLEWSFDDEDDEDDDDDVGEDVLEMLSPSTTLKQLEILRYPGTKFPNWVGNDSFSNIVEVKLAQCQRCSNLPPLGQLASLKHLDISGFKSVVMVGAEFYGNSKEPFSSLETLIFSWMSSWEEWESKDSAKYRNLKTLKICHCPKFIGNLPPFLPSLTEIEIGEHCQGALTIPRLPCVRKMDIFDVENIESMFEPINSSSSSSSSAICSYLPPTLIPLHHPLQKLLLKSCGSSFKSLHMDLFPNLETLSINDCRYFQGLTMSDRQCLQELTSLSSLDISFCHNFVSFPNGGLAAPNLTSLAIRWCSSFVFSPNSGLTAPRLTSLNIRRCDSLVSFPNDGLTIPKLTYLEIMDCFNMEWLPVRMASLSSLKCLSIYGCHLIEALPEGGLPICLSTLKISCHELLRINWNWQTLPHLKHVEIEGDKQNLESFPEERLLPATITSLGIISFSKLKCLSKNGLTQLTSLQTLEIRSCPELDTLSEESFPTSLSSLNINYCPLLEKKYYCSSKISHIPDVTFDFD